MRRDGLTSTVFINIRGMSGGAPGPRKLGTQARVPGEMIGHCINIKEERSVAALAFDDFDGPIEIETIGLKITRAEVGYVQIARDADSGLEGTRTEKCAIERIEAEGFV